MATMPRPSISRPACAAAVADKIGVIVAEGSGVEEADCGRHRSGGRGGAAGRHRRARHRRIAEHVGRGAVAHRNRRSRAAAASSPRRSRRSASRPSSSSRTAARSRSRARSRARRRSSSTWFLGTETGNAIADVLFGAYSPSGRLPASFPRQSGQEPYYYAHKTDRPARTRRAARALQGAFPRHPQQRALSVRPRPHLREDRIWRARARAPRRCR